MTENYKLRKAFLSAFYNFSQRNFGILLILWCSFKLWWNFCLDLLSSKFWLMWDWSINGHSISDLKAQCRWTNFPSQVYFLVCTVNKFTFTSFVARVHGMLLNSCLSHIKVVFCLPKPQTYFLYTVVSSFPWRRAVHMNKYSLSKSWWLVLDQDSLAREYLCSLHHCS
jgi:hypothetical protein